MLVRRFESDDAEEVSRLIGRNFIEINIRDYPVQEMEELASIYNAEKVKNIADNGHMYLVSDENTIVGTGTVASYWGSETESILLTIFVLPEYQGKGVGRLIMQNLENDEIFLRANRVEIPASITACEFYEKMGYKYKNNIKELTENGLYLMEKIL